MLPSFSPLCTLWSNRFLYPLSYNIYLPSHRAERTSLFISGFSMRFIEYAINHKLNFSQFLRYHSCSYIIINKIMIRKELIRRKERRKQKSRMVEKRKKPD